MAISAGSIGTRRLGQFDRMKGAKWFEEASRQYVIVIGQGGIGSWLSLLLTRVGSKLHTFDMDTYENHNMTGQLVRKSDIGRPKVQAVAEICRLFNEGASITVNSEYTVDSYSNTIVMCAVDNMNIRKIAFEKWKANLPSYTSGHVELAKCFFQDGRLLAEQFQILNIPGNRPDLIKKYEDEYLFADSEVEEADCTFKQTSHCAAMIASHMVGFYTNFLLNKIMKDPNYTKLPFFYEYIIPFNMTMQTYVNT